VVATYLVMAKLASLLLPLLLLLLMMLPPIW
jgi:hypothetical protein